MSTSKQLPRKIAVITGTRAEYGLLKSLLQEVKSDIDLTLQLIVTGMHLSPEFGLTYQLIEQDGFQIDAKVEMLLSSDSAVGIAKSVGIGILGFSDAFDSLKPDVIVVLGDRFEILAAVQTAMIMKIPVAHIHGGELTQGAIDDSIRHTITKMSHLHFTAAESYRKRVIQMGEQPQFVFNCGALGIERIKKTKLLNKTSLTKSLNFNFEKPFFLVIFHPETLDLGKIKNDLNQLVLALNAFPDINIVLTKSNADESGRLINHELVLYEQDHPDRVKLFISMGDLNYLSALQSAEVIVGNSSSGIIEAPSLHVPTVNIGCRQEGRLRADSIIDSDVTAQAIQIAIKKALSPQFKDIVKKTISPYDCGDTAKMIKNTIKQITLKTLPKKVFYDLEVHGYEQSAHLCHC